MYELSRRKPHLSTPVEPGDNMDGRIRKPQCKERQPRTSPQPPPVWAPLVPAHPGGRAHRHRKVTGKRRLYVISRRAARAPALRRGEAAAVTSLPRPRVAMRGQRAGRPGWTPGTRRRPQRRTEPGAGSRGGLPDAAANRAGGAPRGAAGTGSVRAGVPTLRAGSKRLRPGRPRGAPVTRLT